MKNEEIAIETLQVEIRVIRVGGHKMTAAVFDQIQCGECFGLPIHPAAFSDMGIIDIQRDLELSFKKIEQAGVRLLGYVARDGYYFLYSQNGRIYKQDIYKTLCVDERDAHRTLSAKGKVKRAYLARILDAYPQIFIAT